MQEKAETLDEILYLASELLDGWLSVVNRPLTGTRRGGKTHPQLAVTFGLAAHTHTIGSAGLELIHRGQVLVAMPLVRTAYECAVTAQWVAQSPEAVSAMLNEEHRQRRNHATQILKAHPTFEDQAAQVAAVIDKAVDSSASARTFAGICDDLVPGGAQAYMIYRALSHMSHATVLISDQYVELTDEAPGFALSGTPRSEPDAATWAGLVARSFLWAGRAVDYMEASRARRSELRSAARRLGITSELALTPEAHMRDRLRQTRMR